MSVGEVRALQQVRVSPSLSVARPHSALSSLALPTMRTGRAATRPWFLPTAPSCSTWSFSASAA